MTLSHPPQDTPATIAPLGSLIRGHRLRIGQTQRELADLSTISVRAIRDLEKGKAQRPRTDTVRLIADALRLGPRARAALEAAARSGSRADGDVRRLSMERAAPPVPLYPLVGRDAETGVLVEELGSGAERLVTVVGLSGVGKTRLALEAAARLHDAGLPVLWHYGDGATADCLRPDDDPMPQLADDCALFLRGGASEKVLPALADALAALDDGGSSVRGAAVLVLDGADTAALDFGRLSRLLRTFPGLRLLITGERPWNVPGERLFLLSPLEAPDPAAGHVDAPAVRFFLSQLRRVRPDIVPDEQALADVAWICHRLDGHPAALGAAASWLTVCDLSTLRNIVDSDPAPLLDHLADGPDGSRLQVRVSRTLAALPASHRALIGDLGEVGDGEFLLQDVVRLTGRPLPECGRLIRELLVSGVIRTSADGGRSAFRVLCVVRAAAGATAGV
ncbi:MULTISPECIES: helix-turn-helix domain-containing protein [unclassified Streptomyces]|uniref:helix-turn-helix domain-containing protein n=1 Tax=unclassified Streptomyces TaxID=2593676 RepID=UPI000381E128|nr:MULTISPECIES: helix-turn-helix domain-containing protein [unclassified Streptomyces]MYQ76391.1 helix-turn-helix domain-containing protein [Streptomyces sp. SID4923]